MASTSLVLLICYSRPADRHLAVELLDPQGSWGTCQVPQLGGGQLKVQSRSHEHLRLLMLVL